MRALGPLVLVLVAAKPAWADAGEPAPPEEARRPAPPSFEASPRRAGPPPAVYEPPPPYLVAEPPPPPAPRHVAPRTSLWLGARAGWLLPFGNLWAREDSPGFYRGESWSRWAGSGLGLELDLGLRLSRNYLLFALYERAQLTAGSAAPEGFGRSEGGQTELFAGALRFSSSPSRTGLFTELAIGSRRFRTTFESGHALEATRSLEFRISLGADARLSRTLAASFGLALGAGTFGDVEWVNPDGGTTSALGRRDLEAGHGTFALGAALHGDLLGAP